MILAVLMCLSVFAACGSDEGGTQSDDNGTKNESKEPTYTPYNVGDITVDIPDGWKAFGNTDIHADDPTTISKRSVNVCKGGVTEADIFTKPYVKIDYYGSDIYMMAPDKSFYENVVDVAPVELGGRTWSGFSCESLGYPIIILTAENGDDQFQVNIFRGQDDDAISLEDEEVKRIIASITVNETADSSESSEDSSADTTAE